MLHDLSGISEVPTDSLFPETLVPLASRTPHSSGFLLIPPPIPFHFPLFAPPTSIQPPNTGEPQS